MGVRASDGTEPNKAGPTRQSGRWRETLRFLLAMALVGALLPAMVGVARLVRGRPSSGLVDVGVLSGAQQDLPNVVVLEMDPNDREALLDHPRQRGRRWERPAKLVILSEGETQFESHAGVRIHGGISRTADSRVRSFRLYFRENHHAVVPRGRLVGFERDRLHRELVLHGDVRGEVGAEWRYINPIAYELFRRVGVPTPETAPTTLVVNAGPPLPYVITEYIDLDFFEARFGHRDFLAFDTKSRTPRAIEWLNPVAELEERFGPRDGWTLAQVSEVVNVDNLSLWFLAALYCGTRDMWQGELVRDRSRPGEKWFWVAWDLDQSFGRPPPLPYPIPQPDPVWEDDQFFLHLPGPALVRDERAVILDHLFRSSKPYREQFADLFQTVRRDLLTPEFLDRVMAHYERIAEIHGVEDTHYQTRIREWFAHRPEVVRRQVETYTQIDID